MVGANDASVSGADAGAAVRGVKRTNATSVLKDDVVSLRALLTSAMERIASLEARLAVVEAKD